MPRLLLDTLYLLEPGAKARLQNDTVVIEDDDLAQPVEYPLHLVSMLIVGGGALVTQPLMLRCAEEGKTVAFVTDDGRFRARVSGFQDSGAALRLSQYQAYLDDDRRLSLAADILAGKLKNCAAALTRAGDRLPKDLAESIRRAAAAQIEAIDKAKEAVSIDQLNGIEGAAADTYFEVFALRLKSKTAFEWKGRVKHPPTDPLNAMLSYVSAIWTSVCDSALIAVGLDPDLGLTHEIRPGRPSLACDLVEEFRAPFIDSEVLAGVNKGLYTPEEFEDAGPNGIRMSVEARKRLVRAIETRRKALVRVPGQTKPVPVGYLPYIQAQKLADAIRSGEPYAPYKMP